MNTKKYDLNRINDYLITFVNNWETPFSVVYIRKILELFINTLSDDWEYDNEVRISLSKKGKKKRDFYEKKEVVKTKIKKMLPVQDFANRSSELENITNSWHIISNILHSNLENEDDFGIMDRVKLMELIRVVTRDVRGFFLGCHIETNLPSFVNLSSDNFQVLTSEPNQKIINDLSAKVIEKDEEIEKLLLQSSQLTKQYSELMTQQELIRNLNLAKDTQIDVLNNKIKSLNDISHSVEKIDTEISQMWNLKLKSLVKKQDFITIVYGENNYNSFFKTKRRLMGDKEALPADILEKWVEKQNHFDRIYRNEVKLDYQGDFVWHSRSKASQYIQNNLNLRFIKDSNAYVVFIDVSDEKYKNLKLSNFVFKGSLGKTYEWHLYSCWVNGISTITPIVYNSDSGEYKILESLPLNEYETRFLSYDKIILQFLREVVYEDKF